MKLFKTRSLALLLTFALLLALTIPAMAAAPAEPAAPAAAGDGTIVILYTNDVHTNVSAIEIDEETGEEVGESYAALAAYKAKMIAEYGEGNVLLADAGDFSQGAVLGTLSKGEYLTAIMSAVGYDVLTIGNHEFDYGMAQMQKNLKFLADNGAAVVSCNFIDLLTGETCYDGYVLFQCGDTTVAFVGITTPESFTKSTPAYFQDGAGNYIYSLCEDATGTVLYDQVQVTVDAAIADGADYVIGLGHLGVNAESSPWMSTEVIANTTGIDAFIDGHSHTQMNELVKNAAGEDVLLTQTGIKFAAFGKLTIEADGHMESQLISDLQAEDEAVAAKVAEIEAENDELLQTVVGNTAADLVIKDPATDERMVRSQETNLGDLCADAYRTLLGSDVAFVNGGGVRANIPAGEITYEQIINVHPFGNAACLVEVTGQQIADALEMGYRNVGVSETGGFLQVSGLTCVIDQSIPSTVEINDKDEFIQVAGERRVSDIMIQDAETGAYAPIDLEGTYTLASHNYMLKDQGDGYTMFGSDKITMILDSVMLDNEVLISYIVDELGGEIPDAYADPYGQGRITILAAAEEPVYETEADTEALNPTPVVVPSTQKLTVNGVEVPAAAYNCDGANYFKLRDLAAILSYGETPFNVSYDEAANAVIVTQGEAYVPVGGELAAVGGAKLTVVSPQKVLLDGVEVPVAAYNIDGCNYFKLRDLGAALGFEVGYDEAAATMLVTIPGEFAFTLPAAEEAPAEGVAMTYAEYLKAFVDSCEDISADQAVEFYAAIDAGDYTAFPVIMLFEQTPEGGYWFGEPALTEAEFAAAEDVIEVADHPSAGGQPAEAPEAPADGAAPVAPAA